MTSYTCYRRIPRAYFGSNLIKQDLFVDILEFLDRVEIFEQALYECRSWRWLNLANRLESIFGDMDVAAQSDIGPCLPVLDRPAGGV